MFSTANGCHCHAIQNPDHPRKTCVSCQGRQAKEAAGITCSKCGVGIWSREGDYEGMNGLCTECYYDD